jgi:hypothetical protein
MGRESLISSPFLSQMMSLNSRLSLTNFYFDTHCTKRIAFAVKPMHSIWCAGN